MPVKRRRKNKSGALWWYIARIWFRFKGFDIWLSVVCVYFFCSCWQPPQRVCACDTSLFYVWMMKIIMHKHSPSHFPMFFFSIFSLTSCINVIIFHWKLKRFIVSLPFTVCCVCCLNVREQYRFKAIQLIFRKFWQQIILFSRCSFLVNTKAILNLYTEIHIKFLNEKISDPLHKSAVLLVLLMVVEVILALSMTFPSDCFRAGLLEGLQYSQIFTTWKYCTIIISLVYFSDCWMRQKRRNVVQNPTHKREHAKNSTIICVYSGLAVSVFEFLPRRLSANPLFTSSASQIIQYTTGKTHTQ